MHGAQRTIGNTRIETVQGDITTQQVDALVNAANAQLAGGGGVDGAIHRAGGPAILEECRTLGGCPTGDAKATGAGALPARWVIHAVGPVYRDGQHGEADQLASAYRRSFEVAEEVGARSLALAALSCGVYGYPIAEAAHIAMAAARDHCAPGCTLELVRFVLFGAETFGPFTAALEALDTS